MRRLSDRKGTLSVVLGFLLLLSPLYVGALHLGEPTYRYERVGVEFTDDGYRTDEHFALAGEDVDSDVACLREYPGRACQFERYLRDGGNGSVPTTYRFSGSGSQYSAVYLDGEFFEPESVERNGTRYMTLEPIPRDEALKRVSTAYPAAPTPIQRAVRTGSASTHRELETAGELVRRGGNYYVVRLAERADAPGGDRILKYLLLGGGVGGGLLLVLSGQRRRVEAETRER